MGAIGPDDVCTNCGAGYCDRCMGERIRAAELRGFEAGKEAAKDRLRFCNHDGSILTVGAAVHLIDALQPAPEGKGETCNAAWYDSGNGGGYCGREMPCPEHSQPPRAGAKWVRTTVGLLESDDGDEALGVGDCLDNYGYELFAPVTIMPTETADTLLEYVRWLAQGWTPTPEERTRLLATIDQDAGE